MAVRPGTDAARQERRRQRLEAARTAWLSANPERVERDRRITSAVADITAAVDDQRSAAAAVTAAERRTGEAIARLRAEGVSLGQIQSLCDLSRATLRRCRAVAADAPEPPEEIPAGEAGSTPAEATSGSGRRRRPEARLEESAEAASEDGEHDG